MRVCNPALHPNQLNINIGKNTQWGKVNKMCWGLNIPVTLVTHTHMHAHTPNKLEAINLNIQRKLENTLEYWNSWGSWGVVF